MVFPEADFVGQDRSFGQRGLEGEQGRLYLMWIEVNLRIE